MTFFALYLVSSSSGYTSKLSNFHRIVALALRGFGCPFSGRGLCEYRRTPTFVCEGFSEISQRHHQRVLSMGGQLALFLRSCASHTIPSRRPVRFSGRYTERWTKIWDNPGARNINLRSKMMCNEPERSKLPTDARMYNRGYNAVRMRTESRLNENPWVLPTGSNGS